MSQVQRGPFLIAAAKARDLSIWSSVLMRADRGIE